MENFVPNIKILRFVLLFTTCNLFIVEINAQNWLNGRATFYGVNQDPSTFGKHLVKFSPAFFTHVELAFYRLN